MTERQLPHSIESEQALLGAILYDNRAYETAERLKPADFFEPFHGRLFEAAGKLIGRGRVADAYLVFDALKDDPGLADVGGLSYLADLLDKAPPATNAAGYAEAIADSALRRSVIAAADEMVADAFDATLTAPDVLTAGEGKLFKLAETGEQDQGFRDFSQASRGALQMAVEAYSRDGGLAGVSSGLIDLDAKVGGLHPSDLIILAGRPSMGKTALATNIAFNVAKAGLVVGFYSLEMSAEQLALRILADVSGVSGDRIRKGEIDAPELGRIRDAQEEIDCIPLHIDATGGIPIAKLAARARRLKRRHGLDLIIVDYLQLAVGTDPNAGKVQEVGQITGGLKALAKDLGVPVIALSQLSRKVEDREDKRPQLADLRDSGTIEQDADMVWFVYRESYYVGRAEPREGTPEHLKWQEDMDKLQGLAEVIVAKQRHGPIGTVKLSFNGDTTKFGNLAREHFFQAARGYRDPTEPTHRREDA